MQLWQFFVRKYSRTSPLECAHILRRQYTVVQLGWQPSNRRQNFRLPADVKRANRVDGRRSQAEFLKILSSLGYTILHEDVTQMINAFDQNGDGEMDFKEFINMVKDLKGKRLSVWKRSFGK